ncbi:MAG: phosphoribosylanthranilate isomerase [Phycisphaerales bacterium]|nr:phosphoribosylanthranilate isomerase [Phycisphaerales bacterium]
MSFCPSESGPVRIKICGVRSEADIDAAIESGADAVGLVLAEASIRHVTAAQASKLARYCGDRIQPVSLLVNPTESAIGDLSTEWVQLHGQEDAACIARVAQDHRVIKAVEATDPQRLLACDADPHIDVLLVDAPTGGSGHCFDHDAFSSIRNRLKTPLMVAGGLSPQIVASVIELLQPWGVDVSSGVESNPGVKSPDLIRSFCRAVH